MSNTPQDPSSPTTTAPPAPIVITSSNTAPTTQQSEEIFTVHAHSQPRDAIVMQKILESMGIAEYEPRVIEQLMELVHRYVSDVFVDAQVYMEHANRTDLNIEDVRLAIESRVNYSYTEQPPIEFLLEMANQKNSIAVLLPEKPCVMLPPEKFCLSQVNYQLDSKKKKKRRVAQ